MPYCAPAKARGQAASSLPCPRSAQVTRGARAGGAVDARLGRRAAGLRIGDADCLGEPTLVTGRRPTTCRHRGMTASFFDVFRVRPRSVVRYRRRKKRRPSSCRGRQPRARQRRFTPFDDRRRDDLARRRSVRRDRRDGPDVTYPIGLTRPTDLGSRTSSLRQPANVWPGDGADHQ